MGISELLAVAQYRCVCGNAMALISDAERSCLSCGRKVASGAFQAGDLTIIGQSTHPHQDNSQPDPLLHQCLKHFQILSKLGQGGMGCVYRAVDESLQRYVALKVIRPATADERDRDCYQRLLEEARAQARVIHPNVVQVYYVDHCSDAPFLAMELVPGETLEDRLRRQSLTFAEIVDIAVQTCRALRAAAKLHIVHGDIKPANLLIAYDGTVKLSDFGLARQLEQISHVSAGLAGTPNYLSPEACRGEPTDIRADMYALGVMLFEMTFGRLPYALADQQISTRLMAHLEWPVQYPATWPQSIPRGWKNLLDRLLAKKREDRFESYDQLLQALDTLAPVELPAAGRAVRPLAWLIDLMLLGGMLHLFRNIAQNDLSFLSSGASVLQCSASLLLLGAAALIQARSGTSPGKKLLQLRVVDDHCQPPGRRGLFFRALTQLLPLWGLVGLRTSMALGWPMLGWTTALVLTAISLIDGAFALFRPDGSSFHDLIFETRVVLDTAVRRRRSGRRVTASRAAAEQAAGPDEQTIALVDGPQSSLF
jgi:serine/threonine protein kinase